MDEESWAARASAAAFCSGSRNLTFAKAAATVAPFRLPLGPDFAAFLCDSLSSVCRIKESSALESGRGLRC